MSYLTIAQCVADAAINDRVNACVAQEGGDLNAKPAMLVWEVASKSDIETAYAYALSVDNPAPGSDETVITDQMILSAVQSIMAPEPEPEATPT